MSKIQDLGYNIYFKLTDIKFWYDIHKEEIFEYINKNKFQILYIILCLMIILCLLIFS